VATGEAVVSATGTPSRRQRSKLPASSFQYSKALPLAMVDRDSGHKLYWADGSTLVQSKEGAVSPPCAHRVMVQELQRVSPTNMRHVEQVTSSTWSPTVPGLGRQLSLIMYTKSLGELSKVKVSESTLMVVLASLSPV
jgi:hypothetical protein